MDLHRFASLQERCRKGSLPLKKRRFQPIKDHNMNNNNHDDDPHDDYYAKSPVASLPPPLTPMPYAAFMPLLAPLGATTHNEKKIAALALVAAAANSAVDLTMKMPLLSGTTTTADDDYSQVVGGGAVVTTTTTHSTSTAGKISTHNSQPPDEAASLSPQPTGKRIRHRPLLRPLPGGCHGRSSRQNSYCRRLPCFNGSSYCKLHYRQYVVGSLKPAENAPHSSSPKPTTKSLVSSSSSSSSLPPKQHKTTTTTTAAAGPPHQQDRRYMGSPNEERCLATTTRGRACAYVSVQGTKYCYLHADYDTNPPPRRGGCGPTKGSSLSSASSSSNTTNGEQASAFHRVHSEGQLDQQALEAAATRPDSSRTVSEDSISSQPSSVASLEDSRLLLSPCATGVVPDHTSSNNNNKTLSRKRTPSSRRTSAKLREKHADSPFPLLSMISTDQWSRKVVRIATGPFKNRTGEVEKWGNGWVSVRIAGVGMHNRRSFELYLHETDESGVAVAAAQSPPGRDAEKTKEDNDEATPLFRCVSRDARSPPLVLGGGSSQMGNYNNEVAMVTPRPSKTAVSILNTDGSEVPLPRLKKIPPHNSGLETPRNTGIKPLIAQARVTPSLSVQHKSRSETSIPLVESLMLSSEEGGAGKKYKLDMLFGTAALERSRRSIHKPSRYEDTEMLAARKRDRKELDGGPEYPVDKRSRLSASPSVSSEE